jgi:Family of unknown function (DUF6281)
VFLVELKDEREARGRDVPVCMTCGRAWLVRRSAVCVIGFSAATVAGGGCDFGESGRQAAQSDCASVVQWNGTTYLGNALHMPHGRRLGTGTVPPCEGEDTPERVPLSRLWGVNPSVALAVAGDGDSVFLAEGFFPELASHPVHAAIERARGPLPRPRRCRDRFRRTGTVTAVRPVQLQSGDDEVAISLHLRTRVAGFQRAGEAYLRAGDRLIVRGRVCGDRTSFADHIRPAP